MISSHVNHSRKEWARHLDLGCGTRPRNPYQCHELYGIDINPAALKDQGMIRRANLAREPIPFEPDFFDAVSAYDFLEHIPRVLNGEQADQTTFPFVLLMNEIWRVLKPAGRLYAVTPGYPRTEAFQDPTHVNIITDKTHLYFTEEGRCGAQVYGFTGRFRILRVQWLRQKYEYEPIRKSAAQRLRKILDGLYRRNSHLLWELEAVKPG
ncbi:MAG TPA: class I SAM-dependent methyltransferase [Burkholderiaceae bacterium]|nr:class I SAM-dependent methyltransferase [Burkholderiaceae bacterium]